MKTRGRVRVARRQCNTGDTVGGIMCKHRGNHPKPKIRIITIGLLRDLSEIKLKRTDTTLDLSQKAKRAKEKRKKEKRSFGGCTRRFIARDWAVNGVTD
jgi:hypothetical protein